jgi:hypothetical protein
VRALVVAVIADQQASGSAIVVQALRSERLGTNTALARLLGSFLDSILLASVKQFHQLGGLAAGSGTHIQNSHTGTSIDQKRGNHANNLLATDVSDLGLGDEELLERGEGGESSNDLLRGGHGPGKLVRVPLNGARGLDEFTLILDGGDLGNVEILETFLDSKRVSIIQQCDDQNDARDENCAARLGDAQNCANSPTRAGESETVWQIPTDCCPEFILLGL